MRGLLVSLAMAASAPSAALLDETVHVPPGDWRAFQILLRQHPAEVACRFEVVEGRSGVRVAILEAAEFRRLRAGQRARLVVSTVFQRSGSFRYRLSVPGDYVLLVDNRRQMQASATVRLRVVLEVSPVRAVRTLPPERRRRIVVASLAGFLAVVLWSGRRLLRAMRQQKSRGWPLPSA